MVRYVLADKNRQVFASRYQLHLPSEAELRAEIQRELGRIEKSAADSPALLTRKKRAPPAAARSAKPAKPQSARARSRGKGDGQ